MLLKIEEEENTIRLEVVKEVVKAGHVRVIRVVSVFGSGSWI